MDWPVGMEGVDIEAWAESAANIYWWPLLAWVAGVVILLFLAVLITNSPVRRRFWCEQAGREVDVAFEEDGPPALRRYIAVVSCTAFSPSTLVQCHRACLDRDPSTLESRRFSRIPGPEDVNATPHSRRTSRSDVDIPLRLVDR